MFSSLLSKFQSIIVKSLRQVSDTSLTEAVLFEQIGNVSLVALNRPQKTNAINSDVVRSLINAFTLFKNEASLKVAVLYGKGGNFSSGLDLEELSKNSSLIERLRKECFLNLLENIDKPIIAAISGYAVAEGIELALLCDLRIVEETATYYEDIPSVNGATVRLPKLIGLSRAMEMIITGRQVNGRLAYDWGLANRVVSTGTALGQALNLARVISAMPQDSLKADRCSLYYSVFKASTVEDAMKFEFENATQFINKGIISNAKKFLEGTGRHGSFKMN
ncbi:enoyl coenzyme A hydratase, mitochondrial [Trichuris trichiura]|uniref:Enoyl coenzyme A hydratase, mitochondrial n=1 Tax=Trichuris trichiura TaxID=36087 RepID=A0A077Z0T1_TRITR|nr:enoyl coenzyme A hydratase, mitochondrial [Trichuris trichiura]